MSRHSYGTGTHIFAERRKPVSVFHPLFRPSVFFLDINNTIFIYKLLSPVPFICDEPMPNAALGKPKEEPVLTEVFPGESLKQVLLYNLLIWFNLARRFFVYPMYLTALY